MITKHEKTRIGQSPYACFFGITISYGRYEKWSKGVEKIII